MTLPFSGARRVACASATGLGVSRVPRLVALLALLVQLCGLCWSVGVAGAASPGLAWSVRSVARPSNFAPSDASGADSYRVLVSNVSSVASNGEPVRVTDTLPAGVTATEVSGFDWSKRNEGGEQLEECTSPPATGLVECVWNGVVQPGDVLEMTVVVETGPSEGEVVNNVGASGGGAEALGEARNAISGETPPFELDDFTFGVSGVDGAPDVQAGDHPYALTTSLDLPTRSTIGDSVEATESIKDTIVDLPLGLVGNPQSAPQCPLKDLEVDSTGTFAQCPADTKVGEITLSEPEGFASSLFPPLRGGGVLITSISPLYNMVPESGHPAEFGFDYAGVVEAHLYPSVVRTPSGWALRVTTPDTPGVFFPGPGFVSGFSLTLFGDPNKHNGTGGEAPFFTNPTDCTGQATTATIHIDTWGHPATMLNPDGTPDFTDPNWHTASASLPAVTGCNALQFHPTIALQPLQPGGVRADSPMGAEVDLKVPQSVSSDESLATPDLRDVSVTLPAGVSLSPSSANGLEVCSPAEIGLEDNSPPSCPQASKIGTVELTTPLLANPIEGSVYLAEQENNPFKSLIALYVVVDDHATGTMIKLAGEGELGTGSNGLAPGQIRTTFEDNPQLPFSELKLKLKEGNTAPLVTPPTCGTYTTTSSLLPWSAPDSGPAATPSTSFEVTANASGGACGPEGFAPAFVAGTLSNQAGGFSPFITSVKREDGEQNLSGVTVETPKGLLADIASVPLCGEAEANAGTCPESSKIGSLIAAAGAGSEPLYLPQPGRREDPVYLTGPYNGGPFGLSIVTHAEAGPFNLGDVIVRASIRVNPTTAQVTVVSDPLPQIKDGIPFRLRLVNVDINRPNFTFNPTNCEELHVNSTITGLEGGVASSSNRFQVANCAGLAFKPKLTASTSGKTSKANGASLHVKLVPPHEGPQSGTSASGTGSTSGTSGSASGSSAQTEEANIARVKVDLPKQLPSRLTTLQKACTAAVFDANPAACPAASIVASAKAITPILPVPLEGPAYFVSHGNEAFPQLILVLQGYGITIDLVGDTFISKAGITSITFAHVPDAPVSSFELTLPQGKYSALTANANLCTVKGGLKMPTEFVGQNGAVIHQSTPISVSGCPPSKTAAQLRAAKLAAALKACHKKKGSKRSSCERTAHKRYNPLKNETFPQKVAFPAKPTSTAVSPPFLGSSTRSCSFLKAPPPAFSEIAPPPNRSGILPAPPPFR